MINFKSLCSEKKVGLILSVLGTLIGAAGSVAAIFGDFRANDEKPEFSEIVEKVIKS